MKISRMTYSQTLEYLYAQLPMYQRIGAAAYKADLGNTVELCNLVGNPQNGFRTVHVAGTNGKGSVSHMLASILQESGYRTGLYTSPHLRDFRERIRVNGRMIPKGKVTSFVERYKADFNRIKPSFFEMTVALAFEHFGEEKIDIGVIEVGMGGRLDSTNIITPLLSIITNISYDHQQFLGKTLGAIAGEKAGIIKRGVPVVIGETQRETSPVFNNKAEEVKTKIRFADKQYRCRMKRDPARAVGELEADVFSGKEVFISGLRSPLAGKYQLKNLATVMAACEELMAQGVSITKKDIVAGIRKVVRNTGLTGRWQVLTNSPLTICDTGHNPGGLKEVVAQIKVTPHKKLHFVIGMVNDKDPGKIFKLLPPKATYYFCKPDIPRGMDADELMKKGKTAGLKGRSYSSVKEALTAAKNAAGKDDLVFVGGSTFVVAEVV